jgi:translation initiation factor IF-2
MISGLIKTACEEKLQITDHHVGKINKETVIRASGIYSRFGKDVYKKEYLKRYAVILMFDPVVNHGDDKEMLENIDEQVRKMADELEVKIIIEKTVYKLISKYSDFVKGLNDIFFKKYPNIGHELKLQILPQYIFLKTTPLLFGVKVLEGEVKQHLIVCAKKGPIEITLGKLTSMQKNKKNVDIGKVNDELCIRLENEKEKFTYGVDFDNTFILTRYMSPDEQIVDRFIRSLQKS